MIVRPAALAAAAALAVVGSASAATLTIATQPVLASIEVSVPACGDPSTPDIPVTWTPSRECDPSSDLSAVTSPAAEQDDDAQPPEATAAGGDLTPDADSDTTTDPTPDPTVDGATGRRPARGVRSRTWTSIVTSRRSSVCGRACRDHALRDRRGDHR